MRVVNSLRPCIGISLQWWFVETATASHGMSKRSSIFLKRSVDFSRTIKPMNHRDKSHQSPSPLARYAMHCFLVIEPTNLSPSFIHPWWVSSSSSSYTSLVYICLWWEGSGRKRKDGEGEDDDDGEGEKNERCLFAFLSLSFLSMLH